MKRLPLYVLMAAFTLSLLAGEYFSFTRPRAPISSAGRLYSFNEHGTIVYLTFWEHLIAGPLTSFAIFALVAGWLLVKRKRENGADNK
jgi:hypothetical protein